MKDHGKKQKQKRDEGQRCHFVIEEKKKFEVINKEGEDERMERGKDKVNQQ